MSMGLPESSISNRSPLWFWQPWQSKSKLSHSKVFFGYRDLGQKWSWSFPGNPRSTYNAAASLPSWRGRRTIALVLRDFPYPLDITALIYFALFLGEVSGSRLRQSEPEDSPHLDYSISSMGATSGSSSWYSRLLWLRDQLLSLLQEVWRFCPSPLSPCALIGCSEV